MPIRTRISGPPGTGKTTKLIEIVQGLFARGYDPEGIVYTSFTRAAATEARDRACAKFKVSKDRFPYFRTLHSLCHELTGSKHVMGADDWCRIGKELSLYFTLKSIESDGMGGTRGDALLRLTTLAKANRVALAEEFAARAAFDAFQDISLQELEHFDSYVTEYKKANGLQDFSDMLEEVLTLEPPTFEAIIGDEAQDFSKLQWEVFDHISQNAKEVFYAGDDDQCIHSWAGADVHTFVQRGTSTSFVLSQSYRVPKEVHSLATRITAQIDDKNRVKKEYKPRETPGAVMDGVRFDDLVFTEGSWMLLARNRVHLDALAIGLRKRDLLFSGPVATPGLNEYIQARNSWETILSGGTITRADCINLFDHLSQRDRVDRGCKAKLRDGPIDGAYSWDLLHKEYGLRCRLPTAEALDKVDSGVRAYVEGVIRRDGKITPPRIEINTIHGSKGREADHVAICIDMTEKTWRGYQANPENEHRVFYVGVTRAKKTLTILQPWTNKYYKIPD